MTLNTYDDVLDECLRLIERGASVEDCAHLFPTYAEALRASLLTIQALTGGYSGVAPTEGATQRGRESLVAVVRERRIPTTGLETDRVRPTFGLGLVPKTVPAVVAMVVLGGAAWGAAAATGNPAGPAQPVVDLVSGHNKDERIELRGKIAAVTTDVLTITTADATLAVAITTETEFEDAGGRAVDHASISLGSLVEVRAVEREGVLVALEVELEDENGAEEPDNSGPGAGTDDGADNATPEDNDDNNSGPGNGDLGDDDDNSGPGPSEDDADESSGPGSGSDDESDEEDD